MSTPRSVSPARGEVRQVGPKLVHGVTREEIGELVTHLTFYAGWPAAMTAGRLARKVFEETTA